MVGYQQVGEKAAKIVKKDLINRPKKLEKFLRVSRRCVTATYDRSSLSLHGLDMCVCVCICVCVCVCMCVCVQKRPIPVVIGPPPPNDKTPDAQPVMYLIGASDTPSCTCLLPAGGSTQACCGGLTSLYQVRVLSLP